MRKLFLLPLFLFSMSYAHAGVWLQSGITLSSMDDLPAASAETIDMRWVSSLTLGYRFFQGFVLGAHVLYSKSTLTQDYTWAVGPKGGLLIGGFEATGTYLPLSNAQRGALGVLNGGGFALNLGYHFQVFTGFRMGLEVLYWYGLYDQPVVGKYKSTQLAPMLSFALDL